MAWSMICVWMLRVLVVQLTPANYKSGHVIEALAELDTVLWVFLCFLLYSEKESPLLTLFLPFCLKIGTKMIMGVTATSVLMGQTQLEMLATCWCVSPWCQHCWLKITDVKCCRHHDWIRGCVTCWLTCQHTTPSHIHDMWGHYSGGDNGCFLRKLWYACVNESTGCHFCNFLAPNHTITASVAYVTHPHD